MSQPALRVCVTGAGGLIGYSLVPFIAFGSMFGPKQRIELSLLDVDAEKPLKGLHGLQCELEDVVRPLVSKVTVHTDPKRAFEGVDYAILAGAAPRGPGMERKDLLKKNAGIFKDQGKALKDVAKKTTKVVVVGNPANTNALIVKQFSDLPSDNVTALTRLDENRARGMIARKLSLAVGDVHNVIIWGNHSATQYPDVNHGYVTIAGKKVPIRQALKDDAFLNKQFIADVQQRGAKVISVRGSSSATSAAQAVVDHVHDWHLGTQEGAYASMAVWSTGNKYGVPDDLIYSFPVTIKNGKWTIVNGLKIDSASRELLDKTAKELVEEKGQALD